MYKRALKVEILSGYEFNFIEYCRERNIFCEQYPLSISKPLFRVECSKIDLLDFEYIVNIEDISILKLSHS